MACSAPPPEAWLPRAAGHLISVLLALGFSFPPDDREQGRGSA